MILRILASILGTAAFALLFGVPRKHLLVCGLIGGAGYALYAALVQFSGCTAPEATFFAAVLVMVLSRFAAVWKRCPVTVFLISGIFSLVPGAGIYWTAYYLVTNQLRSALSSGFAAIKTAFAIVLGIVLVLELPSKLFRLRK